MQIKNKVMLVTGAGSGIGQALAVSAASEGASVVLCDIDSKGLEESFSIINKHYPLSKVKSYVCDVSKRQMVEELAKKVIYDFGDIDILVNNAGVASSGRVGESDYELYEWTFSVNFWGVLYMTKTFLPFLLTRPKAYIANISSVYGLVGMHSQSAYCASKFAVRGFSESLRMELYDSNITVSTVFPGGIKTNIAKNSRSATTAADQKIQERAVKIEEASFTTDPLEAAYLIIQGIKKDKTRILIGKDASQIDIISRLKPDSYYIDIIKYYEKLIRSID